jgi:tetratricopeptide (TPR) repeat protein
LPAYSTSITGIELGDHPDFTLLVISFDREVQYQVAQAPFQVTISFPSPTSLAIPESELLELHNRMIKAVRYLKAQNCLLIETKQNYGLKVHSNYPAFQLILDFAHLGETAPEKPPTLSKKEIKPEPPVEEKPPPESPPPAPAPDTIKALDPYQLGLELKEKGDLTGALTAFQSALATREAEARFQIALIYEEQNQRDQAIEELIKLINDNPGWMEPRLKLGLLYQISGKEKLAQGIWEQVFYSTEFDSNFDFTGMKDQLALLDTLLAGKEVEEKAPPLVSVKNLPRLPYKWFLLIIGLGGAVILGRVISNWRLKRLIRAALDSDYEGSPPAPLEKEPVKDKIDVTISDEGAQTTSPSPPPVTSPEEEEEAAKHQMIYDLMQQNYSIAEIAKMMDMGQEEVKFILDFRQKGEKGYKKK